MITSCVGLVVSEWLEHDRCTGKVLFGSTSEHEAPDHKSVVRTGHRALHWLSSDSKWIRMTSNHCRLVVLRLHILCYDVRVNSGRQVNLCGLLDVFKRTPQPGHIHRRLGNISVLFTHCLCLLRPTQTQGTHDTSQCMGYKTAKFWLVHHGNSPHMHTTVILLQSIRITTWKIATMPGMNLLWQVHLGLYVPSEAAVHGLR